LSIFSKEKGMAKGSRGVFAPLEPRLLSQNATPVNLPPASPVYTPRGDAASMEGVSEEWMAPKQMKKEN
jgi:hypothetical protein